MLTPNLFRLKRDLKSAQPAINVHKAHSTWHEESLHSLVEHKPPKDRVAADRLETMASVSYWFPVLYLKVTGVMAPGRSAQIR